MMASFHTISCDHCDVRDIVETPPRHNIVPVKLTLCYYGGPAKVPKEYATVDLCAKCQENLDSVIINAITQIPRKS